MVTRSQTPLRRRTGGWPCAYKPVLAVSKWPADTRTPQPTTMQFSRLPTLFAALAAVAGTAVAQATYSGASACTPRLPYSPCSSFHPVTYTLAPVLGACGRVCSATYTCTQSGYAHNCYGGDAAVPQAIFQA
jgi:hypothetical protein